MIPITNILSVCITLFITLILPVVVYVIYGLKNKGKGVWIAWLLGAAGFFVFQIIIRTPILSMLSLLPGFVEFELEHYILYCFILAFSAGLFEAAGRYAVAKILSKKLDYTQSFAAGLGHGSIESIFVVGLTYVSNIIYIIMINSGSFDIFVEQTAAVGADTTMLIGLKDSLINTNFIMFLLAAYERILVVILHIALSMLVCYFVSQKKDFVGIFICILCHCTVDFIVPIVNGMATVYLGNIISLSTAYVIIYVFLTLVTVASIITIRQIRKKWEFII